MDFSAGKRHIELEGGGGGKNFVMQNFTSGKCVRKLSLQGMLEIYLVYEGQVHKCSS
jgi:hypothetical protein